MIMDDADKTKMQLLDDVAALRQQLAMLHTTRIDPSIVLEAVKEPLMILTADLRIFSANRAFHHMFRLTPEETKDHLLYDLGDGQWDIPACRHLLETLLPINLSIHNFKVTHQFPRVGQKVMLLNAHRIDYSYNLTPARILLAIEDITERERAARLIHQRSDWISATLASIGDAVLTTDTAAVITFMNQEAERLTGWTIQEALGRRVTDVLVLRNEATQQAIDNPVQRVLREGKVVGLTNYPLLVSRDGGKIPIADSGAPIRDIDGTLHGVVMIFRNVTEQANLERLLVQEKETAETADQAKSEFLASMSHELRTPLGVILGYTDLMREGEFGAVTAEEHGILGHIHKSASTLLELITTMLDLSRLEAGRLPLHVQEVRISALFEELKMETWEIYERARVEVKWRTENSLLSLHTDRGKLKIILKNLLGNALKFTPQGHVTVQARRRDTGVEFCVTDSGIGIPPNALSTIFEPFQQVEEEGGSSQRGTGLGLHIVKRLVELLDGTVVVESEVGEGSTFRVWAPSRPPSHEA